MCLCSVSIWYEMYGGILMPHLEVEVVVFGICSLLVRVTVNIRRILGIPAG